TGLAVTPTAQLLRWGTMGLAYDNDVTGAAVNSRYGTEGQNLAVGFGLLPNLEVSGRVAANTQSVNCYAEPCGIRDLSFNFKAGITLDPAGHWHAAVGATDVGGAATMFRSAYGVVTYTSGQRAMGELDLSAGYAQRSNARPGGPSSPLDGPFASAAYRPWSWLQGSLEYTDGGAWAAARVYAPANWLPEGWAAHLGANFRVHGDERSARNWFNLGLTVPLYKVPTVPATPASSSAPGALVVAPAPATGGREFSPLGLPPSPPLDTPAPAPAIAQAPAAGVDDARLRQLADALVAKGFEDVHVGRLADGSVAVRINNATYNVNSADGLGVALGVLARQLAPERIQYRLVLTQRQIAIVSAQGRSDCLAQWIARETPACTAARLFAPGNSAVDASLASAAWVVDGRAPSWATTRLMLQPVLRSTLATEYGVFDYSLGLRATVQQPLWQGAYAEVSHVSPLAESQDYRDGGVFAPARIQDATDRVLVHQVLRLPVERLFGDADTAARWGANALSAHVALGRFDTNYNGAYGELRWEPGAGDNRFAVEAGRFER
ncbi:MAG TPA: YjbH domain-containing protein, partial [Ramlibacter sp.]|nr:YjbH domain-containing protein [Ramlibacter sp.]